MTEGEYTAAIALAHARVALTAIGEVQISDLVDVAETRIVAREISRWIDRLQAAIVVTESEDE